MNVNNNAGMVRVINVQNVLRKAAYHGSGEVTMEIEDKQIEENSGSWTVCFRSGKAESVVKTANAPDVKLSMPAFSALISGAVTLDQGIAFIPGIQVLTDSMAPWQVFRKKPVMIVDYF